MRISPLAALDPAGLAGVESIYVQAFPAGERIPFAELRHPLPGEERTVSVAHDEAHVFGFAAAAWLRGFPALLLEFLAVDSEYRGSGFGARLWHQVCDTVASRPGAVGVALEVEDPDEPGIDIEQIATRNRRIDFYRRVGADVVPLTGYRVPSRLGDRDLPMRIMWRGNGHRPMPGRRQLEDLVAALFVESYGVAESELRPRMAALRWSRDPGR